MPILRSAGAPCPFSRDPFRAEDVRVVEVFEDAVGRGIGRGVPDTPDHAGRVQERPVVDVEDPRLEAATDKRNPVGSDLPLGER